MLRTLVRDQLDVIAERDCTIAFKEAKIAQLTPELARLRRVQLRPSPKAWILDSANCSTRRWRQI